MLNPTTTTIPRLLLSGREAAKTLGIGGRSFWRLVAAGDIPAVRLGPQIVRFDVKDVEALIERSKTGSVLEV